MAGVPWPRIVRARIVGARRDARGDWRRSKYIAEQPHRLILTLTKAGDRPLQTVRVLSPATIARSHPSLAVVDVVVSRWWVTGSFVPRGGIEIVVGPVTESPANFVGGLFVQYQRAPLCPCQTHNIERRLSGECVCVVDGVIAPCAGVRPTEAA